VLGRGFELRDLEALLEERSGVEARSKLEAHLDRLVADGLLEEDRSSRADRLVFSSGVLRDVLYAAIPRRRRRSLHQRVAEHLERRWSGRLERVVPQLFFHCEQGDLAEKCVEYGLAAARFQLETFSPDDAARTLRTVLEFLRDEGFEGGVAGVETEARRLLAAAHRQAGDVAAALAELETALARCDQGDTAHRLELTALAAATAWEGRRIADTQRWVDEGLAAARAAGDHDELQRLLTLGATVANLAGRQAQATEYLSELESLAPAVASAADLPLGGIARVGMPMVLRAADPVMATTVEEAEVLATVFETLVTTDARGILLPLLAERWEALEGGQAFAFTLRAGVLLHDGRPLTAELVRESLVRAAELGREDLPAAIAALRGGREGAPAIVATGERELRFELAEPLSIFPAMLTDLRTAVAVPRVAEGGHGGHATLAGTGPFELASVAADRIVVEQWAKHWRNAPRVDVVEFRGGLSASALAQGVRDGTLDLAHGLEPEALEDVARDRHLGLTLLESPRRSLYFLLFAAGGALGTSRGARRALGGVLRLQDLVHASLGRLAQPAVGVLPPGVLGHDSGARRAPLAREEAEGLLLASGLPRPLHLRAAVHPALQDRYASLTAALLGAWAELGIDVEVVTRTLDDYRAAVHRATSPAAAGGDDAPLDLLLGRWIANYDDPDSFVGELFHSRAGYFRAWSAGPHLDEAMERARAEAEPAARERLYRRLEGLLADEARVVPLFHDLDCRVAGPRLRHVVLRGTLPYVGYAEMAVGEPPARPVARRERRGALRIPIAGRVQTLDPAQTIFTWQGDVIPTVFETLTRENEAAQIAPFLAARVEAADQGRRFRFRLREDVRFHDGRPLTARDVRWAFLRLLKNRANENRWLLSPIRGARHLLEDGQGDLPGCRVESDHELVLELEKAVSVFPALLAHPSAAIVPEGAETFDGNWMSGVVGTGPFRVTHFAPGARREREANPGYWRPGLPRSQRLVFTFGWSPGEMAAGLRAGELSLVTQLPPAEVEELRRDPRLAAQHHEIPTLSTYYLVLNAHQGPLADEALRHELVSALDVAALVNKHIGRLGVPARGLVPPGLLGYRGQYRPSPTPAPRAVATTGERELTVLLQTAYSELYPELTSALLATLTARGFELNVIELKSSYRELIATTRVDLFLARWVADYPDADTFLYHLLHSEDGLLGHFLGDPEIDRLIEQGRREDSPEVRHDLYLAVERRLAERALLQPLFHEQSHCFVRAEVRGFARRFASVDVDHALLWVE
jgi:ABC-type transport system substrate-binding protein